MPSSLQSLSFGENFSQSLEQVTLPLSLQCLSFGRTFNQSLERVTLPLNRQSLSLGLRFGVLEESCGLADDTSFKFLTYQLPTVGCWPTVAMAGNGEIGLDSGEREPEERLPHLRNADYPILTQGGRDIHVL